MAADSSEPDTRTQRKQFQCFGRLFSLLFAARSAPLPLSVSRRTRTLGGLFLARNTQAKPSSDITSSWLAHLFGREFGGRLLARKVQFHEKRLILFAMHFSTIVAIISPPLPRLVRRPRAKARPAPLAAGAPRLGALSGRKWAGGQCLGAPVLPKTIAMALVHSRFGGAGFAEARFAPHSL